jgi:hypothetical protein
MTLAAIGTERGGRRGGDRGLGWVCGGELLRGEEIWGELEVVAVGKTDWEIVAPGRIDTSPRWWHGVCFEIRAQAAGRHEALFRPERSRG